MKKKSMVKMKREKKWFQKKEEKMPFFISLSAALSSSLKQWNDLNFLQLFVPSSLSQSFWLPHSPPSPPTRPPVYLSVRSVSSFSTFFTTPSLALAQKTLLDTSVSCEFVRVCVCSFGVSCSIKEGENGALYDWRKGSKKRKGRLWQQKGMKIVC